MRKEQKKMWVCMTEGNVTHCQCTAKYTVFVNSNKPILFSLCPKYSAIRTYDQQWHAHSLFAQMETVSSGLATLNCRVTTQAFVFFRIWIHWYRYDWHRLMHIQYGRKSIINPKNSEFKIGQYFVFVQVFFLKDSDTRTKEKVVF